MAFDKINSRAQQNGKSTVYEGNKYEDPLKAMDLVAHILRAQNGLDLASYFNPFIDAYNEFGAKFREDGKWEWESDSVEGLRENCFTAAKTAFSFIDEGLKDGSVKVAVAGGYSAGKSSFVNSILNLEDVLPTGIEPVSMINTYICPTDEVRDFVVTGLNVRDCLVKLDKDVLGAIKHSDRSNVYVSSVLNSIFLDIPVPSGKNYLKHITFVDTPGYNNSKSVNYENAISDSDNATNALKEADAIIWTIDIEAGAISNNDIAFLNNILKDKDEEFPVVILFNKMDKKSASEVDKIMKTAVTTCQRSLKVQPLDIIAYSSDTQSMSSINSNSMDSLFTQIRSHANSVLQDVNYIGSWIGSRFSEQIENTTNGIKDLDDERKKLADKKSEAYDGREWNFSNLMSDVSTLVIDSYDELCDTLDKCQNQLLDAYKGWREALEREYDWNDKSGIFSDTDYLVNQNSSAVDWYNSVCHNLPDCNYYKAEARKDVMEHLENVLGYAQKTFNESDSQDRESLESEYNTYQEHLKSLKAYKKELENNKNDIVKSFMTCCSQALSARRQYVNSLPTIGQ